MNNNGFRVSLITINDTAFIPVICIQQVHCFCIISPLSLFLYALHVNAIEFIFPKHHFLRPILFPIDYYYENRCSLEYSSLGQARFDKKKKEKIDRK